MNFTTLGSLLLLSSPLISAPQGFTAQSTPNRSAAGAVERAPVGRIWHVGPSAGNDFADLPPAVAAASPGDTLLLEPSTYSPVNLLKGIRIVGNPSAVVTIVFNRIPAGQVALLQDVTTSPGAPNMRIDHCDGIVALVDVTTDHLSTLESDDVRLVRLEAGSIQFTGGRSEVVAFPASGGGSKIFAGRYNLPNVSTSVHVALPHLVGSDGYTDNAGTFGCNLYPPGPGLRGDYAQLLVTGDSEYFILGGSEGCGTTSGSGSVCCTGGASAIRLDDSALRHSGALVEGSSGSPAVESLGSSQVQSPPTADPSLVLIRNAAGSTIPVVKVHGEPGGSAYLHWGDTPTLQPSPNSPVEQLVIPDQTQFIGIIPPNGVIRVPVNLAQLYRPATIVYLQAGVVDSAGNQRLSNSYPHLVR